MHLNLWIETKKNVMCVVYYKCSHYKSVIRWFGFVSKDKLTSRGCGMKPILWHCTTLGSSKHR